MTLRPFVPLALVFSAGCAVTPPPKAEQSVLAELRGKQVASAAYFVHERINYMSEGFLHEKRTTSEFGGIWNPNPGISQELASTLKAAGIDAKPLNSAVGDPMAEKLISDSRALIGSAMDNAPKNSWTAVAPLQAGPSPLPEDARKALSASGIQRFVEYIFLDINAGDPALRKAELVSVGYIRITDLATNATVFTGRCWIFHRFSLDREGIKQAVEADGLARAKEYVRQVIQRFPTLHVNDVNSQPKLVDTL